MQIAAVLRGLAIQCDECELPFLLVGGWAVNAHGLSRQTLDVDILLNESDLETVAKILSGFGYTRIYQSDLFSRFRADGGELMDIDCMLTDASTIQNMLSEAQTTHIADVEFRVPSLLHLIAMKLHAVKHNPNRRHGRDLPDVVELVRVGGVDVHDSVFKELCLRFGTPRLYKEVVGAVDS